MPMSLDLTGPLSINLPGKPEASTKRRGEATNASPTSFIDQLSDQTHRKQAASKDNDISARDAGKKAANATKENSRSEKSNKTKRAKKSDLAGDADKIGLSDEEVDAKKVAKPDPTNTATDSEGDSDEATKDDATAAVKKAKPVDAKDSEDDAATLAAAQASAAPATPVNPSHVAKQPDATATQATTKVSTRSGVAPAKQQASKTETAPAKTTDVEHSEDDVTTATATDPSKVTEETESAESETKAASDPSASKQAAAKSSAAPQSAGFLNSAVAVRASNSPSGNDAGKNSPNSNRNATTSAVAAVDSLDATEADSVEGAGDDAHPTTDGVGSKRAVADVAADLISAAAAADGSTKLVGPQQAGNSTTVHATSTPAPTTPDQQFAVDNHAKIITSVHTASLTNGGSMNIRLDPPELGDMQIRVSIRDGVMNASFETNNDRATRMLSHSLNDLKSSLEASGVTVDKLHVAQAAKNESSSDRRDGESKQQPNGSQDSSSSSSSGKREHDRREELNRMWQRLSYGTDPVDLVA